MTTYARTDTPVNPAAPHAALDKTRSLVVRQPQTGCEIPDPSAARMLAPGRLPDLVLFSRVGSAYPPHVSPAIFRDHDRPRCLSRKSAVLLWGRVHADLSVRVVFRGDRQ